MTKKKIFTKKENSNTSNSNLNNKHSMQNKTNSKTKKTKKNDKSEKTEHVYYKDGDYFEMDKIVDHKTEKGKLLYFIKWLGWNEDTNTWEPLANICSKKMIIDYEQSFQKKPYTTLEKEQRDNRLDEFDEIDEQREILGSEEIPRGSLQFDNPHSVDGFVGKDRIKVEWNIRHKTGIKPRNSVVDYAKFRDKHPDLLIKFYEEKCLFHRKENIVGNN